VSYLNPSSTAVAIVGGDPLVGHALELMLLSAGYGARFLRGSSNDVEANPFDRAHLVLIGPRSNDADREALLKHLHSSVTEKSPEARLPVLELVAVPNGARVEVEGLVTRRILWPCPVPDLKREIEAALLANSS
jgi:hypothetical protein